MAIATYFDGQTAFGHTVKLALRTDENHGECLEIGLPESEYCVLWPLDEIRTLKDQAAQFSITCALTDGSKDRLHISDTSAMRLLVDHCPYLYKTVVPKTTKWSVLLLALIAAVALASLFSVVLPFVSSQLARVVSPEVERKMGDEAYEQIRIVYSSTNEPLKECNSPSGRAALDKMLAQMQRGVTSDFELRIDVLDDRAKPVLNAFALPGGQMIFFKSLIEATENSNELAGVLAHEIAHVIHQDSVRSQITDTTIVSMVSILSVGGNYLSEQFGLEEIDVQLITPFLTSSYSREAEYEADQFARDQLALNGIPPAALANFFETLEAQHGDVEGYEAYLSTHPPLLERARLSKEDTRGAGSESLTAAEWSALRNICG